ncbi:glycosyltransferase family 2 protein [Paracrocinitomix mangrovi]|uniref:glycosyltransferase family 2 protein n=1 Tax=Paracrocinitomix mangrovi TaxID=2862509 RepID=UPI001C8D21E2|nr:glycosyltransferase family 2 protein [Paracrocinitomix mangrovi]UKN00608.1 glycosyltransferase family 2 protein [Paracrocinitomix mangrovi]
MESKPSLSIVLPCFNPPEGWAEQVVKSMDIIGRELTNEINSLGLIIVNDGSNKNFTAEDQNKIKAAVQEVEFVSYSENRGKGYALRQGVAKAHSDIIVYTDIDFPYEEKSVVAVARELLNGNEVVLGHRGKDYYENTPWFRKVVSKTLRWVLKTFLRLPTDDSQCGLKGYDQNGAKVFLDTKIDRFLFDLEFIKLAAKRKKKIGLVTVHLKPNIVFSKVNLKVLIREFGNFLRVLFRK